MVANIPRVGMRMVKTALAVAICFFLYVLRGEEGVPIFSTIALNTCISFYRKEKNVPEIVSLTRDTDWAIEAHDPINEMLKQLYQMINQLGQLDKSIILLYLEDKSYEEIAEITGLTVTNVATKLSRIKDKLKRMKKEE